MSKHTDFISIILLKWGSYQRLYLNEETNTTAQRLCACAYLRFIVIVIVLIGHAETAHNRIASVVLGFKEALLEEAEKKKDTRK